MTRIPVPEARRSSPSVSRRKRHVAGNDCVKKGEMTDILDPSVQSKPVLPCGGAGKSLFIWIKNFIIVLKNYQLACETGKAYQGWIGRAH